MKRLKHVRTVLRFVVIAFFSLIVLFAIFPPSNGRSLKRANADSTNAYPGVCLGGWENPDNAAGTPDVPPGGSSFTTQNSAMLNGEQAQIFCGSFQAGDQSQTPSAVTLHFSWNMIFASQASSSVGTDTDTSLWSSVLDTTSSAASTTPDASVATSTAPSTSSSSAPVTASSTPSASTTPLDATTTATSTTNQSGTSLLQNMWSDPFAFLVERTFADTTGTVSTSDVTGASDVTVDTSTATSTAEGDFMDVSYSLDGTTWIDLGQVNMSDWQDYSVTIPVSSWDDINKLQVQLSPDITPDEPMIYLDGMWLEVDNNRSLLGDLQNIASATINGVADLSNTLDNALKDLLTPNASSTPQDATSTSLASTSTIPTPPPPAPPVHQYVFQMNGTMPVGVSNLPWVSANDEKAYESGIAGQSGAYPTVSSPDENTIQITGNCSESYYTILLFENQTDYENDPSAALLNEAYPCVGGNFDQTISDNSLPPQLPPGTYYLMVANQGKKGPWQPYPILYPIVVGNASP